MNRRRTTLALAFIATFVLGALLGFWLGNIPYRYQLRLTGGASGKIARSIQHLSSQLSDKDTNTLGANAVIARLVEEADSNVMLGAVTFCRMSPDYRALIKRATKTLDLNAYIQKFGSQNAKRARAYILQEALDGKNCVQFKLAP